jgi:hypothetical protein
VAALTVPKLNWVDNFKKTCHVCNASLRFLCARPGMTTAAGRFALEVSLSKRRIGGRRAPGPVGLELFNPAPDPERYARRLADGKAQAEGLACKLLRNGLVPADVATALLLAATAVIDHLQMRGRDGRMVAGSSGCNGVGVGVRPSSPGGGSPPVPRLPSSFRHAELNALARANAAAARKA